MPYQWPQVRLYRDGCDVEVALHSSCAMRQAESAHVAMRRPAVGSMSASRARVLEASRRAATKSPSSTIVNSASHGISILRDENKALHDETMEQCCAMCCAMWCQQFTVRLK
jgi:hypothetical protein